MAAAPHAAFSHLAMVVQDLETTGRFYAEAFGFELDWADDGLADDFAPMVELPPPVRNRVRMYVSGAVRLELVQYVSPAAQGAPGRVPMNRIGLTHMSFRVADIEATLAAVRRLGGTVMEETRARLPKTGDYIMCLDPDGVRVELMPLTPLRDPR
jgi:catechol 2,3-dioxygenase-like lactoylglutathione lyase family enzyme